MNDMDEIDNDVIYINDKELSEYHKIEKLYVRFLEMSYEDLKGALNSPLNIYAYYYGNEHCEICGNEQLSIVDVYKENGLMIVTLYCEDCNEYCKYYIKEKHIVKQEYFVEEINNTITKKDERNFNLYKLLSWLDDLSYDFLDALEWIILLIVAIMAGIILVADNILSSIYFGGTCLAIIILYGIFLVFELYKLPVRKIDKRKVFYLKHYDNYKDNVIYLDTNSKYKKEGKQYDYDYLHKQRQIVSDLRLKKIRGIFKNLLQTKTVKLEKEIDYYLHCKNENDAKELFMELRNIKNKQEHNDIKLNNINNKILKLKKELSSINSLVSNKYECEDELEQLAIDDEFDKYKKKKRFK